MLKCYKKEDATMKKAKIAIIGLGHYIYFNQFIDTTFKQEENKKKREGELTYFQPLNVFNKNASRFYSSSNNYNVIKKRKNEHDFIQTNDIYTKKDMAFTNENKMRVKSAKIQF